MLALILRLLYDLKVLINGRTQAFQILLRENFLNPSAKSPIFKKVFLNVYIKYCLKIY